MLAESNNSLGLETSMNTPDESVSSSQLGAWPSGNVDKDFQPILMIDKALDVPKLVEVDATSVCVQWSSVPVTVHSTDVYVLEYLMSFVLEMQQIKSNSEDNEQGISEERWCTQYSGPATHVQVKGLHPGRKYALRVKCHPMTTDKNVQIKLAPPSGILIFQTKSTCPSAMLPPVLIARGEDFLNLKWSEPEENGGREISEYVLEGTLPLKLQDNAILPINAQGMYEVYRGSERTFVWRNLSAGVRYNVRVKAVNCLGEGAFSSIASFLTQASAPDAPSQIFCTSLASDSLTFEWLKPSGNGAEVTGYRIEMDNGRGSFDFVAKVQDCMVVLAKLQPDSEYAIRVCAENAKGVSTWSSPLAVRTLVAKPEAPVNLSYVLSEGGVIFSWQSVGGKGGETYTLEARESEAALGKEWKILYQGSDTMCETVEILPDLEHIVRVKSVNPGGESYSEHINVTIKSHATPSSIHYYEDESGNYLSWVLKKSKRDSGDNIVFEAQVSDTSQKTDEQTHFRTVYQGEEPSCLLERLSPGTKYKARVRMKTDEGVSKWSNHVCFKPSIPLCTIDDIQVRDLKASSCLISWDISECARQPKSFTVGISRLDENLPRDFKIVYSGQETSCTVLDLLPETAYECKVRGEDNRRLGPWSKTIDFRTTSTLPNAPRNFKIISKSRNEVQVDWMRESCSDIVKYIQIEANRVGQASPRSHPIVCQVVPNESGVVKNLLAGCQYSFRIRSGSSTGWGPWSDPLLTTTEADAPARPGAPRAIPAGAGNAFKLSWEHPEDNGSTISDFEVATSLHRTFDDYDVVYRGPDVSYRVTNLAFGSKYFVRVRAYNSVGKSDWSDNTEIHTSLSPPAPPKIIKSVVQEEVVRISWQEQQASVHHAKCIGYEVEMNKAYTKSKMEGYESKHRLDKKASAIMRKSYKRTEDSCSIPLPEYHGDLSIRIRSIGEHGLGHGSWSEPYILHVDRSDKLQKVPSDAHVHKTVEPGHGMKSSMKQSETTVHPHRKQRNINQLEMKVAKKPKQKDEMTQFNISLLILGLLLSVLLYLYLYS